PGELLVGFRAERVDMPGGQAALPAAAFDRFLADYGVQRAAPGLADGRTYRLRFREGDDLRARQEALLRDPSVAFAEPNWIMSLSLTPNDEYYLGRQWGPRLIGAERAWDITRGGPVVIAVLDTGISPTHPDLADRLVTGYDFVNDDADPADDNGHGTFTGGVAAARGNNGLGVAGIAWDARLMPVKILDGDGRGPVSVFAQGIRYAVENGAKVVNVSAGVPVPSQAMEMAVAYAIGQGVTVVAAAGNGRDELPNYPAAYPSVLAVSASTANDDIADFSSYGAHIWLAAPGRDIVSTYFREADTYAQQSGSSAAAPFVSGTVALMLSQRPGLAPRTVREILRATAVDLGPPGLDPQSGNGRLDVYHAILLATDPAQTLPGATVTPASGKATDAFILTAAGFAPNEPLTAWLTGADGAYHLYRYPSRYANARGEVQVALGNSTPLPAGDNKVTVRGETSGRVAVAAFKVTPAVNTQAFAPVAPVPDSPSKIYFAPTGHTLGDAFLRYWRDNGGLAIFGHPISEEFTEVSPADGKPYLVQYFERNRFELHPEHAGTPNEVLLGLLGRELTRDRTFPPAVPPFETVEGRAYFPETGHSLSGAFLQYWRDHGGLAIFGHPISEPFDEVNPIDGKPYLVQYFERNRFELHPEYAGTPNEVLLGLLGVDSARSRGYIAR
ncbi:MAG: S8 family peptidase, partial [Chloroflexota bacterium]|nr:S8 family peptidase [Chloroflexota bacterium]